MIPVQSVMTCIQTRHKQVMQWLPLGSSQVSAHRGTRLGECSELNVYVGSLISTSFIRECLVQLEGGA